MKVDLAYLEKLSKLEISSDKKAEAQENFDKILNFIDSITKLELPEEDRTKAVPLSELREDEPKVADFDATACAPKKKDGCYVTPLVVE